MSTSIQLPPRYSPNLTLLGSGGFGAVYRTADLELGRSVAVKVPFERGAGPRAREVLVELRAAAGLRHPGFVQVLDAGLDPKGVPYLVMEFANLGSLAMPLQRGKVTWKDLTPWIEDLLAGLAYAHARGLVHRDVKPENVLLQRDEGGRVRARLGDFGLAKVLQGRQEYKSTRLMAGTLLYMPPESFENDPTLINPGIDLYAVGVMIHQLVSGTSPWAVEGPAMLFAKAEGRHQRLVPRPEAGCPEHLADVVDRLLAPDHTDRFQLAADVREALFGTPAGPAPPLASLSQSLESSQAPTGTPRVPPAPAPPPQLTAFPPTAALALVREPLFVNRDDERARLWSLAREACLQPRGVVLAGASGQGCSRLASWLTAQLDEAGVARTLRVRGDRTTSPTEALAVALRTFLVLGRSRGDELAVRIERWLGSHGNTDAAARDGLVAWLDAGEQTQNTALAASEALAQRVALTELVLRLAARRGLVCCWWEEHDGSHSGAPFIASLLRSARARSYPLLLLYEPDEGPVDALDEPGWETLEVGMLGAGHLGEILVDLALDPLRVPAVSMRARGNAARAVEAARLLCSSDFPMGSLSPDDTEEVDLSMLADETLGTVELDAPQVGLIRLEGFCRKTGSGVDQDQREALLAALAVLPRPCPQERLGRVWDELGRWESASLLTTIESALFAGLVTRDAQGRLDFEGGELAHAAAELLAHRPSLPLLRQACAHALVTEEGAAPALLRAAAALLLDAGQPSEALELLMRAAMALARIDSEAAQATWAQALSAANSAGLVASDPLRVRIVLGAVRCARELGDVDRADEELEGLDPLALAPADNAAFHEAQASVLLLRLELDAARLSASQAIGGYQRVGDAVGVARARLLAADALTRQGRRDAAIPELERALAEAGAAGADRESLWARWLLARCLRASGLRERAATELAEVLSFARELGVVAVEGAALRELGNLALLGGDRDTAEARLRESAERLEQAGLRGEAAVTRISLGELARSRGDLARARRQYSAAFAVTRAYGLTSEILVSLVNLGITELAMERERGARRRLAELDRVLPPGSAHGLRVYIEALRLVVQVLDEAWEEAEESLESLVEGKGLPPDPDLLFLLERAGDKAAAAGEPPLAVDAWDEALKIAQQVGDEAATARLRSSLGSA